MERGVVVSSVSRLSDCGIHRATKCFVTEQFVTTFSWVATNFQVFEFVYQL